MSRGGFQRGGSSRGGFSSRGGSSGGSYGSYAPQGPPDTVLAMGSFVHACEGEMVCKSINTKIPYFNAPIFLENKKQIGKVDEILGPLNEVFFTVKLDHGVQATSFVKDDKVYIGPDKLLPIDRFLPKPAATAGRNGKPVGRQGMVEKRGGRGGMSRGGFSDRGRGGARGSFGAGRGAPRGSFGASRGSFGAPRGAARGGFAPRGRGGY